MEKSRKEGNEKGWKGKCTEQRNDAKKADEERKVVYAEKSLRRQAQKGIHIFKHRLHAVSKAVSKGSRKMMVIQKWYIYMKMISHE